ncbi:prenyltransferase/squalene oxidase repeat-containing protein [Thermoplasmatota archaeon]
MNLIHDIDVEESISKGIEYLVNKQHEDGSVTLADDTTWDVWETVNAILAVHKADKNKNEFIEKAISFLLNAQRTDYSFYVSSKYKKNDYCLETSPTCVLALNIAKKKVNQNVQFILNKQKKDGSWEIGIPDMKKHRFWPSITGHVLRTLLYLDVSSYQISKGITFLLEKQIADGSWGSSWIYYDTPYYPIHVILQSLNQYGMKDSKNYKKSISFIKKNQKIDGSWCMDTTDKPRPSKSLRTSLALNSLLISPDESNLRLIEKGIKWLALEQESDGHWDGGFFVNWPGKKEDIYATSMAIISLKKYVQYKKQ